jgi:hypothetical protein
MLAAYRKRHDTVFLNAQAGYGARRFFLEHLNEVIRLSVMELAIDFTEVTADTDLFINIDLFHENPSKYGIRQPLAANSILACEVTFVNLPC